MNKNISSKTIQLLAIMCVIVMVIILYSCDRVDVYNSEVGHVLPGTYVVYKADVVKDGETVSVEVDNYNEYKGLYRYIGLNGNGDCYMKYNDFLWYSDFDGYVYRLTRVFGVYSTEGEKVIVRCKGEIFEFSHNKEENILCGEIPFLGKGDTPVRVYLKKVSKCYL